MAIQSEPVVPIDERTVADLLLEADIAARQVLWDDPPDTTTEKARSWGEVVEAAAELWSSFPDRTGDLTMDRILRLTTGLHRSELHAGWPGPGESDQRLDAVVEHLSRAAELISARRHPTARLSPRAHLDSEAARTRIMHVVYVSAHGVGLSLRWYYDSLRRVLDAKHNLLDGQSVQESHRLMVRVGAAERLAGSYLEDRWPVALAGQHRPPVGPERLRAALDGWDIQARRTMAGAPTTANVHFAVMVQRHLTVTGARVLAAAAQTAAVKPGHRIDRLQRALESLDERWAVLGNNVGQITGRVRRTDPDLRRAGEELRSALHEVSTDLGGPASPGSMAARVDLRAVTAEMQRSFTLAIDLAQVLGEVVRDPDLMGPARSVEAACLIYLVQPDEAAWVEAADLHVNRAVLVPAALRESMATRSEEVSEAAVAVDAAAGFLGRSRVDQLAGSPGRAHEDREPPGRTRDTPDRGRER